MTTRLPILFLVAATSFVVIGVAAWFVLGADLHSKKADPTASTAVPSRVLVPEPLKKALRGQPNDDEDTCTGSGQASRFLDLRSEKQKAGLRSCCSDRVSRRHRIRDR